MIDTTEELSKALKGKVIEAVEFHEDGLHVSFSNGQILIFVGVSIIGLLEAPSASRTIQ